MLANYGYKDGSGDRFITIDTGKCDGCGPCKPASGYTAEDLPCVKVCGTGAIKHS